MVWCSLFSFPTHMDRHESAMRVVEESLLEEIKTLRNELKQKDHTAEEQLKQHDQMVRTLYTRYPLITHMAPFLPLSLFWFLVPNY